MINQRPGVFREKNHVSVTLVTDEFFCRISWYGKILEDCEEEFSDPHIMIRIPILVRKKKKEFEDQIYKLDIPCMKTELKGIGWKDTH